MQCKVCKNEWKLFIRSNDDPECYKTKQKKQTGNKSNWGLLNFY